MFEILQKTLYASIGTVYMTKEKIEALGQKIAQEAKLSAEQGKKLVDDLVKRSEDARDALQKMVKDSIDSALKRLDIPTRQEVKELEKRLKKLEEKQ